MLGLLYFWRLEKEKWFDAIIEMIEMFIENNITLPFEIFVFGSGSGEKKIVKLAGMVKNIHFFWRQDLETIKRYVSNCDYCLMPSECLESFGLSALTAMKLWIPPIWYARWWLKKFIDPALNLTHQLWTTTGQKLYHLVKKLINKNGITLQKFDSSMFQYYTKENRVVRFHALAGKNVKKILIVSDFINKIGGIETYINDVKDLLEPHGYEIELYGWKLPSGIMGKVAKYIGIVTWLGNFRETIKLQRKIKEMQPDLIRYHSVMRYFGRAPIRASKNSPAKKRMMFHDLGYFYPFPSEINHEDKIKTPFSLKKFLDSYPTSNPLKILAIIGKYISLSLIKDQLKKRVDTFLVPSEFMKDIVHKSYKINNENIKVFPHFIQE